MRSYMKQSEDLYKSPGTGLVETVVLLRDKKGDGHIDIDLDFEKLDKTGGSLTVLVGLFV